MTDHQPSSLSALSDGEPVLRQTPPVAKGAALARHKPLPPKTTDAVSRPASARASARQGREDRVAFRFPAKRLAACYPAFATWQGCSSSCTPQPMKKERKSHEQHGQQLNCRT